MRNPLDPENWGDYPTRAELALDLCAKDGCRDTNEQPQSRYCWWHASPEEQREIDVARADSVGVDEDWGSVA